MDRPIACDFAAVLTTIGYRLYGLDRVAVGVRVTAGIGRVGASTTYSTVITVADDWQGYVVWDSGEGSPRYTTGFVEVAASGSGGVTIKDQTVYAS